MFSYSNFIFLNRHFFYVVVTLVVTRWWKVWLNLIPCCMQHVVPVVAVLVHLAEAKVKLFYVYLVFPDSNFLFLNRYNIHTSCMLLMVNVLQPVVRVLSWSSCAGVTWVADFNVFVCFHLCFHPCHIKLLCQWYPVLQIWSGFICRLWSWHWSWDSCSIRLRQFDLYQVWFIWELLDKTSFLHQTNNNYLLYVIYVIIAVGKATGPPPWGPQDKILIMRTIKIFWIEKAKRVVANFF